MALSGSVSTSSYEGRYLTLSWSATQSTSTNQSTISWTLSANGGSSSYYYTGPVTVVINDTTVYSLSSSDRYAMYKGTVASNSIVINHNADGTKSFTVSVRAAIFSTSVNCTGSQTFTLDPIQRGASISQTLAGATETTISMNWVSDSTISYVEYSTDGGSHWVGVGNPNNSSGSYTVTGLSPGATYNMMTRVTRKSSGVKSTSYGRNTMTYSYPTPLWAQTPNFTIGEAFSVGLYNPLGRDVHFVITANGTEVYSVDTTSAKVDVPNTIADALYQTIPNDVSALYYASATYNNVTRETRATYYVGNDSAPTIGSATYIDANASVVNITGDNKKIIPGKSKLTFTASNLSAQNYSSLASAKVTINGTDYAMTLSGSSASVSNININTTDSTATVYVTDSRGLTSSKAVSLDIVEYVAPTMSATAQRVSGFYSSTEITPATNYTYIGTNAVTIQLQARKTSESSYTVTQAINPSGTTTVSLDNQYPWYILLTITDSFGGSSTFEITIGKGIPLFYFDIVKSSVSMDMFPTHSNAFEVNGDIYIKTEKIADFVIEEVTSGIWTIRKWSSGLCEVYGKYSDTSSTAYTSAGVGYYRLLTVNLPNVLTAIDNPQVSARTGNVGGVTLRDVSVTALGILIFSTATTGRPIDLYISIKGRWK